MKFIVQTDTLYDRYHRMVFGYIGKDLETGETHYYTMYDNSGKYSPNYFTEFNINQENHLEILSRHLYHCDYKKDQEMVNKLPSEILSLVSKMISKHLIYNKEHDYPTDFLINNSSNLSVQYKSSFSLFGDLEFSGKYVPVQNTIEIPITNNEWNNYRDDEKNNAKDVLLHETGHLKVATYRLDAPNKQLKVKIGFYNSTINVEPIILNNGDIFLKTNKDNTMDNEHSRILEEVMNDFDCMQINQSFNPAYPKIGHILNKLCDGRLQMARYYDDGIEELYESLFKIIKSRNMVDELLESIKHALECEENKNHMMKLLNNYCKMHDRM